MRERGVSSKERCEKVCARAGAGFLYVHARGGGGGGARVCTHIYTYICTRVCSTHQRVRQGKNVYTAAHTGTHIYIYSGGTDRQPSLAAEYYTAELERSRRRDETPAASLYYTTIVCVY